MKLTNPNVTFSTINRIYDNAITDTYSVPWVSLVELMKTQGHKTISHKDTNLISPWDYKTLDEGATERVNDDGELWTLDDKPVVARLAENVKGTNMIMLDYDGTISISQAKNVFSTYEHFGYTSYSHKLPAKNGADCFRIILPLAEYATADDITERRKAIYNSLQGIDKSCLSLARSFYVPSCAVERLPYAHMWHNNGDLFSVFDYDKEVVPAPLSSIYPNYEARPIDKDNILSALSQVYLGNEPEWFNVAVCMYSNGFTYEEFESLTLNGLMHQKTSNHCKYKWKGAMRRVERGHTLTVGYIVNLCKKHGVKVRSQFDTLKDQLNEIDTIKNELAKRTGETK
jgi:hypothetical protein